MYKAAFAALPLMVGAYYFSGYEGYSRVVDRSPEQVAAGLADLDITDQPGAPGSQPIAGVTPMFKHERTADGLVFRVMSGNEVATSMFVHLVPVDGGKRTKVTASVERGNAPDDFVSPAFRSESLTMGLFSMALEDELDELTARMTGDRETCEELYARFERSNMASADLHDKRSFTDAVGDVSKTVMKLNAFEAEARRLGCDNFSERFGESPQGAAGMELPRGHDPHGEPQEMSDWGDGR